MKFHLTLVVGWCAVIPALFLMLLVHRTVGQDLSDPEVQAMLVEYESEHMVESYRFK